jgi:signal transduction histidine kinase/ActR/RegA family two-component response regulator
MAAAAASKVTAAPDSRSVVSCIASSVLSGSMVAAGGPRAGEKNHMAAPSEPTHPAALRSRLFVLAASGLVPLVIMVALALGYVLRERQATAQQSALALSRALAIAIDAELRSTAAVLRAVSENDELKGGRFEAFYHAAVRVAAQQHWRAIVLNQPDGQAVFRTSLPYGRAEPRPIDPESVAQALVLQRPVVGVVAEGRLGTGFAVRVPITAGPRGSPYILSAILTTDQILDLLKRQSVPPEWVVGVYDQSGRLVARTRHNGTGRPSPTLQQLLDQHRPEGMGVTYTVEGVRSHTGYTRLGDAGWVVAVAIPDAEATQAAIGPIVAVLLGLAASLGLSAYLGWFFARRVTEPIVVLKDAAAALGRGEPVHPPHLEIAELDDVGTALAQASQQREQFMQELQQGQLERDALLGQVTEALQSAQEAGRIKDEFLAVLGHELRNPLAPISMAVQLMSLKGDGAAAAERRIIERQLAHMTRLVDDLLDLSRITGKRLTMRLAPVRIVEILQQAADSIGPVLGGRSLRTEFGPGTPEAWVSGDEARLAQVFGNLLGNAVKFTPADGEIVLAAVLHGEWVDVDISDNGIGMSAHVVEHAFEPFFQERQGGDRSRGGLGLGLAIVKSLVEMHGGSVAAESGGHGSGSRFHVRLPLTAAPQAREAAAAPAQARGSGKVLVVDDNRDAADTTAALLEITGYEVRTAYDPSSALATLDGFVPDVALLDIGLPGMSGYELARHVRAHPNGAACRLIALTGYGQADDIELAKRNGFDLHLTKPVQADVLVERVRALMKRGDA